MGHGAIAAQFHVAQQRDRLQGFSQTLEERMIVCIAHLSRGTLPFHRPEYHWCHSHATRSSSSSHGPGNHASRHLWQLETDESSLASGTEGDHLHHGDRSKRVMVSVFSASFASLSNSASSSSSVMRWRWLKREFLVHSRSATTLTRHCCCHSLTSAVVPPVFSFVRATFGGHFWYVCSAGHLERNARRSPFAPGDS